MISSAKAATVAFCSGEKKSVSATFRATSTPATETACPSPTPRSAPATGSGNQLEAAPTATMLSRRSNAPRRLSSSFGTRKFAEVTWDSLAGDDSFVLPCLVVRRIDRLLGYLRQNDSGATS